MRDVALATEFLADVPPFNTLSEEALEAVAQQLEASYYPEGKRILESNPAPGLAVIRKGAVRLKDGDNKFLDKRSEGGLFGHHIYFHGKERDYVAEAEEDCLIWHLSPEAFERLRERHESFEEYFSSHVKKRVQAAVGLRDSVKQARDVLQQEPVLLDAARSIREAAKLMSEKRVSSVLIMRDGALAGIVTDKDLRQRVLAAEADPGEAIGSVMTEKPRTLPADADVDTALLMMMRQNYHHLPIMDGDRPVGLVTAGDILRTQSEHPLRLVRDIYKRKSLEGLVALSERLPSLFARMVNMGRDVEHIGRMVTHITDAFTVRLLQLAAEDLGDPPMEFAWIVFGSQAREEQTAKTDQDNGIVLEREPEDEEEARYFSRMADFVCAGLDRLGYVYCPGEIMALNAKWRMSLKRWKRQFNRWIEEPDPKSVMHCSIFFDMRCVHGDEGLVDKLCDHALSRAQDNRIFRRFMAANVLKHTPPIGFFRRFVQESDGSHTEGLNLKHRGIVPIIDLVRMRALECGIREANTFRRLELAVAEGALNESDASSLRDALMLIGRIRLSHQAEEMSSGLEPGNFVPAEELSPLMRRNLKAAFMLVVEAQNGLQIRYQVH